MNGSKMGGGDELGNFLFLFFLGGGSKLFLKKWFTAHKNTCTYPIFYLFLWGGTFSKKLGGSKLF